MSFSKNELIKNVLNHYLESIGAKEDFMFDNTFFCNGLILNDYLSISLNDLGIENNDEIIVKQLAMGGGGPIDEIHLFFEEEGDENLKSISISKGSLIEKALVQYLKLKNAEINLSPENIYFINRSRILNYYLKKSLNDLKIRNYDKIIVCTTGNVIGSKDF